MGGEQQIRSIVQTHGWAVIRVEGDDLEADYAYSIGLFEGMQHPEIIIFGLPLDTMQQIINSIGEEVRKGKVFSAGSTSEDVLDGYLCAFREVAPAAVRYYMGGAVEYYGGEVASLHCIWPDRRGRFPWDPEASATFRQLQPMLSEGPEASTNIRPAS